MILAAWNKLYPGLKPDNFQISWEVCVTYPTSLGITADKQHHVRPRGQLDVPNEHYYTQKVIAIIKSQLVA